MNSFHQIVLGAGCVAGAFLLGQYLNRSDESADNSENSVANGIQLDWQTSQLEPTNPLTSLPTYRNSSRLDFDFQSNTELPPPSDLTLNQESPRSATQVLDWESRKSPLDHAFDRERFEPAQIEVPDFSELAAQFRGTNLELATTTSPHKFESELEYSPNSPNAGEQSSFQKVQSPASQEISFEQSYVSPIDPDQLDDSLLSGVESTFRSEDFTPHLREHPAEKHDWLPRETSVLESNAPIGISGAQAELVDRKNRVISYNDPFPPLMGENSRRNDRGAKNDRNDLPNTELNNRSLSPEQPVNASAQTNQSFNQNNWQQRNANINDGPRSMQSIQPGNRSVIGNDHESYFDRSNERLRSQVSNPISGRLEPLQRSTDRRLELTTTRFVNHLTREGETLGSISTHYYGKPDFYLDIYLANQTQMRHPGDIQTGIVLRIPVYE